MIGSAILIFQWKFHVTLIYMSCEFTDDGSSATQDETKCADLTYEGDLREENVESDRGAVAKLSSQTGKY